MCCKSFDGDDPGAMRFARNWQAVETSLTRLECRYRAWEAEAEKYDIVVRHRPTEFDAQLGIVADLARRHGIAVPLIACVVSMIHKIERGELRMSPANMGELRVFDRASYPGGELTD